MDAYLPDYIFSGGSQSTCPPPAPPPQKCPKYSEMTTTTTTTLTANTFTMSFPEEVRVTILQYLDDDSLGSFACVSKQCYVDSQDHALPQTRVAVIEGIRSSKDNNNNNIYNFHSFHPNWNPYQHTFLGVLQAIHRAARNQRFTPQFATLQLVRHAGLEKVTLRDAKPFVKGLKLYSVTKLNLSLKDDDQQQPSQQQLPGKIVPCIPRLLSVILPHLQQVDLSYMQVPQTALVDLAKHCPLLNTVICRHSELPYATGYDLQDSTNLTRMNCEGVQFHITDHVQEEMFFYGLDNRHNQYETACLLGRCLQKLEHLNLKQASYVLFGEEPKPLTQTGLMKVVRHAPNLRTFGSDLTWDNIDVLKAERPEIVFL